MADNTRISLGTEDGDIYASKDNGGVKHQRTLNQFDIAGVPTDVSDTTPFPVVAKGGQVSTNNSSIATLAGGAQFIGLSDDVTHFASVSVSFHSDVTSAEKGVSMEFSSDGTNWDHKITATTSLDVADYQGTHRLSVSARYFRVVYTNGASVQASFRLQVLFHSDNSLPLQVRANETMSLEADCALTRVVTPIDLDIAREQVTGQRTFFFNGHNMDIDTAWEDVHALGGDINWLTTATKVEVLSTHADDNSTGDGCRSVEIHGLSATGVDQSEVVAMNGITAVESALTYIRVNSVHSEDVGTYGGSHKGDITCRITGAGAGIALMMGHEGAVDTSVQYGLGESAAGYYSVPLGKVLYITRLCVNATPAVSTDTVDIALYEREGILLSAAPYLPRRAIWEGRNINGNRLKELTSYVKIKALTDIWFRASGTAVDNEVEVSLDFYLLDENADGK